MSRNPSNLRHMAISRLQRIVVLQFLPLSRALDPASFVRLCAPQSNVAVVAAAEDVLRVGGECCREDALHAFRMIDIPAVPSCAVPEADRAVVGRGDEFFSRGREGDVHDGGDVVFEDIERTVHLAGVEDINVVIFVGDGEVEGFHRVPGYGV